MSPDTPWASKNGPRRSTATQKIQFWINCGTISHPCVEHVYLFFLMSREVFVVVCLLCVLWMLIPFFCMLFYVPFFSSVLSIIAWLSFLLFSIIVSLLAYIFFVPPFPLEERLVEQEACSDYTGYYLYRCFLFPRFPLKKGRWSQLKIVQVLVVPPLPWKRAAGRRH